MLLCTFSRRASSLTPASGRPSPRSFSRLTAFSTEPMVGLRCGLGVARGGITLLLQDTQLVGHYATAAIVPQLGWRCQLDPTEEKRELRELTRFIQQPPHERRRVD